MGRKLSCELLRSDRSIPDPSARHQQRISGATRGRARGRHRCRRRHARLVPPSCGGRRLIGRCYRMHRADAEGGGRAVDSNHHLPLR
jgi:hypothetical protein